MYIPPSARRKKKRIHNLNLVPVLDIVFNLIFFLLISAEFTKIFDISGDTPIIAKSNEQVENAPPLDLKLHITQNIFELSTGDGANKKVLAQINYSNNQAEQGTSLKELHQALINFKKEHQNENVIIFEPDKDISYDFLVKVMDQVRDYEVNDKKQELFKQIVYGIVSNEET